MRTNEFIEKVVESGFTVEHENNNRSIVILFECEDDEYVVATVDKTKRYVMNTKFSYFLYTLDAEQQEKLFNLLVEYTSTLVEEREEEKKYYIVMQEINDTHKFLNLNKRNKRTILSTRSETLEYQTQFTKSEIEKYGLEIFTENPLFKLVEVQ